MSLLPLPMVLLVDVVLVVVVARVCGAVARWLGQPAVVGEITGGLLLGPTLLPSAVTAWLVPTEVRPALGTLATVGVAVFTFFVGAHLDRGMLRGQGHVAVAVSAATLVVPFLLGAGLALVLAPHHAPGHRLPFVLFLATAMSVTAFPVLARILVDRGLLQTAVGGLALACAALVDVVGWGLLALVAALAGAGHPWRLLLALPYLVVLLAVVRPALVRAVRYAERGQGPAGAVLAGLAVLLVASTWVTDRAGLHAVFGAFLLGAVMPHRTSGTTFSRALAAAERISGFVLLPIFFVVAGLHVDVSVQDPSAWGTLALVLLVAVGGKLAGTYVGARAIGVSPRHSRVLAILANARGLTELVVLSVGLELAVIDGQLYSLMVVMALVTTAMTGVLLKPAYPPAQVAADRRSLNDGAGDDVDLSAPEHPPGRPHGHMQGQGAE